MSPNRPFSVIRCYDIAVGATSTAGTAISSSVTTHVLLTSNVGCYVAWNKTSPVASVPGSTPVLSQVRLTPYLPLIVRVPVSVKFAVIEDVQATAGVLTVTELDG